MLIKFFVYGTLKQGFPLSMKSDTHNGTIVSITPACLNYGKMYTQEKNTCYPYLVLNAFEYLSSTFKSPRRPLDVQQRDITSGKRKKVEPHIYGELVKIVGTRYQLENRLIEMDMIEGFDEHNYRESNYVRRLAVVNNLEDKELERQEDAWLYCLPLASNYIRHLKPVPTGEWVDKWNMNGIKHTNDYSDFGGGCDECIFDEEDELKKEYNVCGKCCHNELNYGR